MSHIDEIELCERRRINSLWTSIFSSTVMSSICSICFAAALRLFWCSSSSSLDHRTEMMSSSSSVKEMTSRSYFAMSTSSKITSYRHVSWSTIMLRVDRESWELFILLIKCSMLNIEYWVRWRSSYEIRNDRLNYDDVVDQEYCIEWKVLWTNQYSALV
jgi:hypothetical protein